MHLHHNRIEPDKISIEELDALLATLDAFDDDNEPAKISITTQSRNHLLKKRQKRRAKQIRSMSTAARDATLSIKCKNQVAESRLSKKDLYTLLQQTFFNTKDLPEYSRLPTHHKILLSQFIIHTTPDAKPTAFTFRYNLEQRKLSDIEMNKKIQRKLSKSLKRPVLFWSCSEYDDVKTKILTHRHGELLLYPNELQTCETAFKEMFGLEEIDANGTKKKKAGVWNCIDFSTVKRKRIAEEYGEFYAVYNWVGYSIKNQQQQGKNRLLNKVQKFSYIPSALTKQAANFYKANISHR
jgi:Zn-finger protein